MDLWRVILKCLIVFILNFTTTQSKDRVKVTIALGAGKKYPQEYLESGMRDDTWVYLIQTMSGDNGITISASILIFMTLHFLLMRGCGRYILRFFIPFYLVGFILLSVAIIIQVFGLVYFETVRILCYLFIIGIFTVMAFATPMYFIWVAQQEALDAALDPEQNEQDALYMDFIEYQASLQRHLRAIPLPAPPVLEQIDVGTDPITYIEPTRQPDADKDTSIYSEEDLEATSAEEEVGASSPEVYDAVKGAQENIRTRRVKFDPSTAGTSSEGTPRPRSSLGRGRGSAKKPKGKGRKRR